METPRIVRQAVKSFIALAIFPVQSWHFPHLFKPAVSLLALPQGTQELFLSFLYVRSSLKHEDGERVEHCKVFSLSFRDF